MDSLTFLGGNQPQTVTWSRTFRNFLPENMNQDHLHVCRPKYSILKIDFFTFSHYFILVQNLDSSSVFGNWQVYFSTFGKYIFFILLVQNKSCSEIKKNLLSKYKSPKQCYLLKNKRFLKDRGWLLLLLVQVNCGLNKHIGALRKCSVFILPPRNANIWYLLITYLEFMICKGL